MILTMELDTKATYKYNIFLVYDIKVLSIEIM